MPQMTHFEKLLSSIQYGGTEKFCPLRTYIVTWVIFWSETFLDKNCLIFWSKKLNQFTIEIMHKDLI